MVPPQQPEELHPRIDPDAVDDLRYRLARARLPEPETTDDQGIPRADLERLLARWRDDYDWERLAARIDSVPQLRVEVDGLAQHAVHVRSPRPDAVPLLLGHGWPSTVYEFLDLLPLLVDPADDGAGPAFHVVCPSLPGFGFAGKPDGPGWNQDRTADAWVGVMAALGYDDFVVHGGDWGAIVGTALAVRHPDRVRGLHLTMPQAAFHDGDRDDLSVFEADGERLAEAFRSRGYGYAQLQRTRPQTVGYSLVDSPVGLLAWVGEKLLAWSDTDSATGASLVPDDVVLDVASVYWFTACGASAARMYYEGVDRDLSSPVTVPAGFTIFAAEPIRTPRAATERRYRDVRHWSEQDRGGHFAAVEAPEVLAAEIRTFAATL